MQKWGKNVLWNVSRLFFPEEWFKCSKNSRCPKSRCWKLMKAKKRLSEIPWITKSRGKLSCRCQEGREREKEGEHSCGFIMSSWWCFEVFSTRKNFKWATEFAMIRLLLVKRSEFMWCDVKKRKIMQFSWEFFSRFSLIILLSLVNQH